MCNKLTPKEAMEMGMLNNDYDNFDLDTAQWRRQQFAPDEVAAIEEDQHAEIEQAVTALKARQQKLRVEVTVDMITAGAKVLMEAIPALDAVTACQYATGVYIVMERAR
jgi:hypothetical protein